jgi:hypothetical protein
MAEWSLTVLGRCLPNSPGNAARQKRLTLDGDHFYVDLVFYNRLLRCFVLVDLKLGKLTHQDLGQMQMYVNFFDRFQRAEHEAKTIGIVLCSAKNDAMVKITLPEDDGHVLAARYQMYLPTEEELRAELTRERREAEGGPTGGSDTKGQRPSRIGGTCTMTSFRYGGRGPNHASR